MASILPCLLFDLHSPPSPPLPLAASLQRRGERVLVHCKAGHGRSAAVALCWLLTQNPGIPTHVLNQQLLHRRKVTHGQGGVGWATRRREAGSQEALDHIVPFLSLFLAKRHPFSTALWNVVDVARVRCARACTGRRASRPSRARHWPSRTSSRPWDARAHEPCRNRGETRSMLMGRKGR